LWLAAGEPASDGVREYLGGVLIAELGVGGAELGGRPRSFLWLGVRAMSERSSCRRTRGRKAMTMLTSGTACRAR
jgi:hypothetical protein